MKGWVVLVGWPIADGLPTLVVTHQPQVDRRTGKVRRPETDVLPLCHATVGLRLEQSAAPHARHTLYFEVELSSDRRPGTEQNTSTCCGEVAWPHPDNCSFLLPTASCSLRPPWWWPTVHVYTNVITQLALHTLGDVRDVTESVATIRSPFCGYNMAYCMELRGRRFIVIFI